MGQSLRQTKLQRGLNFQLTQAAKATPIPHCRQTSHKRRLISQKTNSPSTLVCSAMKAICQLNWLRTPTTSGLQTKRTYTTNSGLNSNEMAAATTPMLTSATNITRPPTSSHPTSIQAQTFWRSTTSSLNERKTCIWIISGRLRMTTTAQTSIPQPVAAQTRKVSRWPQIWWTFLRLNTSRVCSMDMGWQSTTNGTLALLLTNPWMSAELTAPLSRSQNHTPFKARSYPRPRRTTNPSKRPSLKQTERTCASQPSKQLQGKRTKTNKLRNLPLNCKKTKPRKLEAKVPAERQSISCLINLCVFSLLKTMQGQALHQTHSQPRRSLFCPQTARLQHRRLCSETAIHFQASNLGNRDNRSRAKPIKCKRMKNQVSLNKLNKQKKSPRKRKSQ